MRHSICLSSVRYRSRSSNSSSVPDRRSKRHHLFLTEGLHQHVKPTLCRSTWHVSVEVPRKIITYQRYKLPGRRNLGGNRVSTIPSEFFTELSLLTELFVPLGCIASALGSPDWGDNHAMMITLGSGSGLSSARYLVRNRILSAATRSLPSCPSQKLSQWGSLSLI